MSHRIKIIDKQTGTIYEFFPCMRVYRPNSLDEKMFFFKSLKEINKRFRDVKPKDFKEAE